jgi:hypothetical protein
MKSGENKDNNFSSTVQKLAQIEEKLREIGVGIEIISSVLKGEATFTVSFDPLRPQEYTAR